VPSQCAREGVVWASARTSLAFGAYGAISGASIASTTQARMIAIPTVAGVDSPRSAIRRLQRRTRRARDAAGDDAERVPAAIGVLIAQARMRGSSSMYARSPRMLVTTARKTATSAPASMSAMSLNSAASSIMRPKPGYANTVSTTTTPAIR